MALDPFDLNLRHLRALTAIVARRSMSAAAETVSLSQPALTQGLAKLERQLGILLFQRGPGGVVATAAGRILIERTQVAFAHLARTVPGASRAPRGFARPDQLMTATQLRAFLSVADAGSFVGAAGATGLSQPALHRAVRDLEQLSGTALVERRGRGVALSLPGHRLARGVRLAAKELQAALAELSPDVAGGDRIVIGAMPLSRALLLPRVIAQFVQARPLVTVDVVEGAWRDLVEPLRDGVIDLMMGALRGDPYPDLEQRPLFVDRLVVIGRVGHPLAATATPTLDQLTRFPWVVGRAATPLRMQWQTMFAGRVPPAAPVECGSVMTIRGILRDSDFLTLLSPAQVALELEAGILTTIGPPVANSVRNIGVTVRSGWRPTDAQSYFLRLIDDATAAMTGSAGG